MAEQKGIRRRNDRKPAKKGNRKRRKLARREAMSRPGKSLNRNRADYWNED